MDDFEMPEDLNDVEIIYSDDDSDEENHQNVEVEDLAKLTFVKNSQSVFASDLTRDSQIAVTGGQDDCAYVWSTSTADLLFECTGHKDSVTEVNFNYDSQLVATGDMAGMVQVWAIKDQKLIWCNEGDDLEWLTWHPLANILICGSKSGDIYIWQVPAGNCKVLPSHGSPCTTGKVLPDGKRLVAGYSDGLVKLWDIKATSAIWQCNVQDPHDIIGVTALDINSDSSLLAVAPTSTIIKINDGKSLGQFLLPDQQDVETVLFYGDLYLTGSISGHLCVWDWRRKIKRHTAKIECAVTVMKPGLNERVFVGAADGSVLLYDIKGGSLLKTFTGHKAEILSLTVSGDDSFILSTSEDGTAKIFTTTL